jgi:hypothetical protein
MMTMQRDETLLIGELLEAGLCRHFGRPVQISAIERRPHAYRSTHPIDQLIVTLHSGEQLRVVFKQIEPGAKTTQGVQHPKGHKHEILVYHRLLAMDLPGRAGWQFGAPALYAALFDEENQRYWLFLEDVGSASLDQGSTADWHAVFRWLGTLHAPYFGREAELRSLECLADHGPAHYRVTARVARENLELAGSPALGRFDRLMTGFESVIEYLSRQPRTIIHGDIIPDNLLLQRHHTVRPIDWESAAIGVPGLDLVPLLTGWGEGKPRLLALYQEELVRHLPSGFRGSIDAAAFERMLVNCGVIVALWYLGWSLEDARDSAYVDRFVDTLEALMSDPRRSSPKEERWLR